MYNSRLVRVCRPKGTSPMYRLEIKAEGLAPRRRFSLKTTDPREADQLASIWDRKLSLIESGEAPRESLTRVSLLEEVYGQYLAHLTATQAPANTRKVLGTAYRWIRPQLRQVTDLTPLAWDRAVGKALSGGIKGQTLATYHGILGGMFQWAVSRGLLPTSPMAGLTRPEGGDVKFRRDFHPQELMDILRIAEPEDTLRYLLLGYTGQRGSTILALRWDQVDLEAGVIRFPPSTNKSKKDLTIPIHPDLAKALRTRHATHGGDNTVLPVVDRVTVYRHLMQDVAEAGVDPKGICLHSLRHTFAAILYEASGKDIRAVQELLGHSSPTTTAAYLGVDLERKRLAVDAMPSLM